VRPDRSPDQAFARQAVQPPSATIALPGGEHEREIPRVAGLLETLGERDQQRLWHRDPDEAAYGQRVAIEEQPDGVLSSDDLRAPRRPSAGLCRPVT